MIRGAILAVAAALLTACATLPQSHEQPASDAAFRATGNARIQTTTFAGAFDLALLVAPPDRLRLDVMLPVGTPAAIFFVESGRWILLDPAASVAWHGTIGTIMDALQQAAPPLQGTISLALHAASRYLPALLNQTKTTTAATTAAGWGVTFHDPMPDQPAWWRHWSAQRGPDTVEVHWTKLQPLAKEQQWLLEPRVPQSFSWQSWRSAPAAVTAPRQPASRKKAMPPGP